MVVLIRSLPAKLIQNWILFLVKLVKTHFGHLEVYLALVFIPGVWGGLVGCFWFYFLFLQVWQTLIRYTLGLLEVLGF